MKKFYLFLLVLQTINMHAAQENTGVMRERVDMSDQIIEAIRAEDIDAFRTLLDANQFIFTPPLDKDLDFELRQEKNVEFKQIFKFKLKEYNEKILKELEEEKKRQAAEKSKACVIL